MTKEQKNILIVKYTGRRIEQMNDKELGIGTELTLIKISIITGWQIPDHEMYSRVLIEEMLNKFKEAYGDLTFAEILYAMRNFGSAVEDYGKAINLSLIDKVINAYRAERIKASQEEEKNIIPEEQKIFTQEELDNSAREVAQLTYSRYLSGGELFNPEINKAILMKDNYMKEGQTVVEFFKACASVGMVEIYVKQTNSNNQQN